MKWRERWNVDDIANWKTPRAIKEYSPHGLSGFDKEGSPSNYYIQNTLLLLLLILIKLKNLVIICPFAGMDMWGSLHAVSRADFIRATIQNLEFYMNIGMEQSKKHGPGARQFVILFDMKDFNLKQYTWRPGKLI